MRIVIIVIITIILLLLGGVIGYTVHKQPVETCPLAPKNVADGIPCPDGFVSYCASLGGLCYNPANDITYSTYYMPQYDHCPDKSKAHASSNIQPSPVYFGNTRMWVREGGKQKSGCTDM